MLILASNSPRRKELLKGLEIDSDSLDDLYNLLVDNNIEITSGQVEEVQDDELPF